MLTCFYDLLWLLGANCSPEEEEAKYHPLTRFALMALARKNYAKIERCGIWSRVSETERRPRSFMKRIAENLLRFLSRSHFSPEIKKLEKSSQKVCYHGTVYHYYAYNMILAGNWNSTSVAFWDMANLNNNFWEPCKMNCRLTQNMVILKFVARGHFRGAKRWKTCENGRFQNMF